MASLLILILGYILFLILCGGIVFWLIAKPFRIDVRLLKSIGVVAVANGVGFAVLLAVGWFLSRKQMTPGLTTGMLALTGVFVITLFPGVVVVLRLTRTTILKAMATYVIVGISQFAVALAVRATAMEAFVVSTGSMATAVIGEHGNAICDNCNRDLIFEVTPDPFSAQGHATCINCLAQTDIPAANKLAEGDRVLTLKHRQPRRWEVAAFKGPHRLDTTYLGRIVGLPGETVELVDGDLFINSERIVKPADQFESMWAFVHDSSFVPQVPVKDQPRWQANPPESGTLHADGKWILKTDFVASLQFNGEITADLEYSMGRQGRYYNTVSDVRIDVNVDAMSTKGSLQIAWLRGESRVVATFRSNGQCSLESSNQSTAGTYDISAGLAGKRIGLAMRDGVASLLVDDKVVTTLIIGPQKLQAQGGALRDNEPVRCSIVVNALDAHVTLGRILVRRDVHYLSDGAKLGRNCQGCTNNPIRLSPNEFFSLGDNSPFANDGRHWDEIDPSLQGRFQLGTVPDELMVGVAHWIYWPLHRAGELND